MSRPWYPFYWSDYAGDTAHLSMVEHGAYILLMQHYYQKGRPLPASALTKGEQKLSKCLASDEALFRVCRCTTDTERHAVLHVLREFFYLDGDEHRHKRIDAELKKANEVSKKRAEAGKKGGSSKCQANAKQLPTLSLSQSQLSTPHVKGEITTGVDIYHRGRAAHE